MKKKSPKPKSVRNRKAFRKIQKELQTELSGDPHFHWPEAIPDKDGPVAVTLDPRIPVKEIHSLDFYDENDNCEMEAGKHIKPDDVNKLAWEGEKRAMKEFERRCKAGEFDDPLEVNSETEKT
jgi:hypothetical protein